MKKKGKFLLFESAKEYYPYLMSMKVEREIDHIQQHHTYKPDYSNFNGKNHFELVERMENYHVEVRNFDAYAAHITTFPDGKLIVSNPEIKENNRIFDKTPAGIKKHNEGGICIENVGNFDKGKDYMTEQQKNVIVSLNAMLLNRFKLSLNVDTIYYHTWSAQKTCPGTNFFGGNSKEKAKENLFPLIKSKMQEYPYFDPHKWKEEGLKHLHDEGIINNLDYWKKRIDEDMPVWAITLIMDRMYQKLKDTR